LKLLQRLFFTTFTYYTTLVDEIGNEFIRSSFNTITEVVTAPSTQSVEAQTRRRGRRPIVTETFALKDAIIPGKARPVTEPSFVEPSPPFGPIVKTSVHGKPFQPIPTPPANLIVEPLIENPNGEQVFIVKNTGNNPSTAPIQSKRRKIIKTLRRKVNSPSQSTGSNKQPSRSRGKQKFKINNIKSNLVPTPTISKPSNRKPNRVNNINNEESESPYVITASTIYTIYSYIYEVYNNLEPVSTSKRDVTVSNKVRPTIVTIPSGFRVSDEILNTIELGKTTATLGQRVTDTLTTEIFLASATLVQLSPTTQVLNNVVTEPKRANNFDRETTSRLQPSLGSSIPDQTESTPVLPKQNIAISTAAQDNTDKADDLVSSTTKDPRSSRGRGSSRFKSSRARSKLAAARRKPKTQTRTPSINRPRTTTPPTTIKTPTPLRSFRVNRHRSRGQPQRRVTSTTTPKPQKKIINKNRQRIRRPSIKKFNTPITQTFDVSATEKSLPLSTEKIIETTTNADDAQLRKVETSSTITTTQKYLKEGENSLISTVPEFDEPITNENTLKTPTTENELSTTTSTSATTTNEPLITTVKSLELTPKQFRFKMHKRKNVNRDPLFFKSDTPRTLPPRENVGTTTEKEISTTLSSIDIGDMSESSNSSFGNYEFVADEKVNDSFDDYYYYETAEQAIETPTTEENLIIASTEEPSEVLPKNVIYKTFTTTTFMPIQGGEQTLTLNIITSTLETLKPTDVHLITEAPELFNEILLPKPIRATKTTSNSLFDGFSTPRTNPSTKTNVPEAAPRTQSTETPAEEKSHGTIQPSKTKNTLVSHVSTHFMENNFNTEKLNMVHLNEPTKKINDKKLSSNKTIGLNPFEMAFNSLSSSPNQINPLFNNDNELFNIKNMIDSKDLNLDINFNTLFGEVSTKYDDDLLILTTVTTTEHPLTEKSSENYLIEHKTGKSMSSKDSSTTPSNAVVDNGAFERTSIKNAILSTSDSVTTEHAADESATILNFDEPVTVGSLAPDKDARAGRKIEMANLELQAVNKNLETKVMSNGVHVIVAGDRGTPTPLTPTLATPVSGGAPPAFAPSPAITLPPSTLSGQVLLRPHHGTTTPTMVPAPHQQTRYTTLTYYGGVTATTDPLVVVRRETLTSVLTTPLPSRGSFVERTQMLLDSKTYYTTKTLIDETGDGSNLEEPTKVITQVVVTEYPSVSRVQVTKTTMPMVVTKTYLTTFTYYTTNLVDLVPQVETDVVVSSEVVTETVFTPHTSPSAFNQNTMISSMNPESNDDFVYATRTFYTTSSHLTTLLEGANTITTSVVTVNSRITTETFPASMFTSTSTMKPVTKPTEISGSLPKTEAFVMLDDNVYKHLQTHHATFTHYTTMVNGDVKSREVTKTRIESATITTTSVPKDLTITQTETPGFILKFDEPQHENSKSSFDHITEANEGLDVTTPPSSEAMSSVSTESSSVDFNPLDLFGIPLSAFEDDSVTSQPSTESSFIETTELTESSTKVESEDGMSVGSGAAIGLMVPVISAMAGFISNNMGVGPVIPPIAKSDTVEGRDNFPKNTLIRMAEPDFIPVGGVGASIRSAQLDIMPTVQPMTSTNHVQATNAISTSDRGSFTPPSTTERGFTAVFTTGVVPTQVSVISGVETIIFSNGLPKPLPPSGLPARKSSNLNLMHSSLIGTATPPLSSDSNSPTIKLPQVNQITNDASQLELFAASNMSPQTISIHSNIISTDTKVNAVPSGVMLHSTVGVGSSFLQNHRNANDDFVIVDKKVTTVVNGVSTMMSGATTIFGSPFTRPAEGVTAVFEENVATVSPIPVVEAASNAKATNDQISKYSTSEHNLELNHKIDDTPSFIDDVDTYTDEESKASLDIEEENEVSRVINNGGSDVNIGGPIPITACGTSCSASNEMCKEISHGKYACVCRPGFLRKHADAPCRATKAYKVRILLDSISHGQLVFDPILHNLTHPVTKDFSEMTTHGLEKSFKDSLVSEDFNKLTIIKFDGVKNIPLPIAAGEVAGGGVVAEVKVELSSRELKTAGASAESARQMRAVKEALEGALAASNFSLGGTEIFASPLLAVLDSDDFDECSDPRHHDCHAHALCFNTQGSFSCACKAGFSDHGTEELPGRLCAEQRASDWQCGDCSGRGRCVTSADGLKHCRCEAWYAGDTCQISLKVLLAAAAVLVGCVLVFLLVVACVCCLRGRDRPDSGQLIPKVSRHHIKLDNDDGIFPPIPYLIPRVSDLDPRRSSTEKITLGADEASDLSVPQAALLDVLEANQRSRRPPSSRPSSGSKRPFAAQREQPKDKYDDALFRSKFEPDETRSSTQIFSPVKPSGRKNNVIGKSFLQTDDLASVHGQDNDSVFAFGTERASSALRSCGETTLRPSTRHPARPASQLLSEDGVAEREETDTVVYPQRAGLFRVTEDAASYATDGGPRFL